MSTKNMTILGPVKRNIFTIISAIFLILICCIYLLSRNKSMELEDKTIINVFGKQRMFTQMISKDASQLYALMQTNEAEKDEQRLEHAATIRMELTQARDEFSATLNSIHNRQMITDTDAIHFDKTVVDSSNYLKQIDNIWSKFEEAISVLIEAEHMNEEVEEAAAYIYENNMELLNLCDRLLEQILAASLESDQTMTYIAYGMIAALFLIVWISLYHLQRFLMKPFGQLYKGIADIGLHNYPTKPSFPTSKKVMPIVTEINDMFLKINHLINLIENINNKDTFYDTLRYINNTFSSFVPYNYIGIALIDDERKRLKASYGVSDGSIVGMPERIVGVTWMISDTSMESLLNTGEARIINDLEEYCAGSPMKPYNKTILEAGIRASITLPLQVSGVPVGMIFFSSKNKNVYNEEHLKFLRTLANSIAISLYQNIFVNDILYSSVLALAKLAEARDEDTGEHMERMGVYSKAIAEMLYENNMFEDEIDVEYIESIERYSPLHDIGKVGILDGILLKPGKLTPEEFDEMKKHTNYGAEVLKSAEKNMQKKGRSLFGMGIEIAEGHHEKWDGSGYPHGKKGYEIPLSARIVAVADVFDALTSKRPYKQAFPFETSVSIIAEGRGKHFDPDIVDVFLRNIDRISKIYHKSLSLDKDMV